MHHNDCTIYVVPTMCTGHVATQVLYLQSFMALPHSLAQQMHFYGDQKSTPLNIIQKERIMRRVAITLAAVALLAVAPNAAQAADRGALSYPMAAHVAANYGIQHSGHNPAVLQQTSYRGHGSYGYRGHGGHFAPYPPRHHGHRPVIVHRPIYRYPTYVPLPHYGPYNGFQYYGPGFSIGIGF